ncbi:enoyl-CoA hydratase/isomerase family protein [Cupriavidus consociatus]|uniref:enoyl-CoA hydratase/isomerase family protein n=1 Tax=Cupriavidus consociatus TaxID=2821357 RepID=UPI001AE79D45|nr:MULTISPECIES: enoyl-CoA hydratase/isomerase family protein [unclassified Cupriavidus]MBP0621483.1 enoyl-CoA hydratase/isomerase family protein [Cupriavidus sp. LEh25]MDK2658156.1 enoyl-CoA hydratase/isomerase family protein [Cupriavidus sp. LEh21]
MHTDDSLPALDMAGHVATITLRRPDVANRLGPDDLAALMRHIETVNGSEARVLRLRSTGKYFCSGFDIGKLAAGERGVGFEPLVNALEDCRAVTIAEIHGGVYGGGTDLALACDFRLGTEAADMFMPAARLGLHFYQRGMERYVSRLGLNYAKRLFLTAERLNADEMLRCGFLTELLSAERLRERAEQLSATVAGLAPLAVQGMKRHLNAIGRGALDASALAEDIRRATQSQDIREGALAWQEKREPRFTGT